MMACFSGNDAVALAAVNSGAAVLTGYPGTPSTEVIGNLIDHAPECVSVRWCVNEKVALEIAAGAAWAGQRAFCSMKMSGLNVCYDSLISIAYSGCTGALVVYVCDDPGVSAGMPEQDIRGFAMMTDIPVIDCIGVEDSYRMTEYAFSLSERIGSPVLLRSVTAVALCHENIDLPEMKAPPKREARLHKDIAVYTKAGAEICLKQHSALIERLSAAQRLIHEDEINHLHICPGSSLGVIISGALGSYLSEGTELAKRFGATADFSLLWVKTTLPAPAAEFEELISHCGTIAVIEENEPYVEHALMVCANRMGKSPRVVGKEDGTLSRVGSMNAAHIAKALLKAQNKAVPPQLFEGKNYALASVKRTIGVCAGCPHRGTFLAINAALKNHGLSNADAFVAGDIGCTILGISPPFNTLWTEVSMGSSIPIAEGFNSAGVKTPALAAIGDSTFFHGGIPGLIDAVWNNTDITVVIMDNGWTGMTGMQANPGTAAHEQSIRPVDIAKLIPALGVEAFAVCDPYDHKGMSAVLTEMLGKAGVKVVLARRECAIQAGRRKLRYCKVSLDSAKCVKCKLCISKTGCPALKFSGGTVSIDAKQCNGCGICADFCNVEAIKKEDFNEEI